MSANHYERRVRTEPRRVVRRRVVVEPPNLAHLSRLPEAVKRAVTGPGESWLDELPIPIRALSDGQLIPAMQGLVEGRIIDWGSKEAVSETKEQAASSKSLFNRVVFTAVVKPSQEGDSALGIFTDELSRFLPDQSILQSPLWQEYWCKLMLGLEAYSLIEQVSKSFNKGVLENNRTVRTLYEIVEERIGVLVKSVGNLKKSELSSYLSFADLMQTMEENGQERKHPIPQTVEDSMQEYGRETKEEWQELRAADIEAWEKLRVDWEWPQIMTAAAMLPTFRSQVTVVNVMAALESNLLDHSARLAPNQDLPLTLNPTAVRNLLRFRWQDTLSGIYRNYFEDDEYSFLAKRLEENIEFPGFSVPRRHLPSAAIELLTKVSEIMPENEFINLLIDINTQVDTSLSNNWLLTLLVLKERHPKIGEFVSNTISQLTGVSEQARNVFLDQRPGRAWLSHEGKIRATDRKTTLQSAYSLYTSTFQPDEEPRVGVSTDRVEKRELAKKLDFIEAQEVQVLPYMGEVGILAPKYAKIFIETIFSDATSRFEEDDLLTEVDKLQKEWRSGNNRKLLFLSGFPGSLPIMDEARKIIGIEAAYVQGNNIVFVFDREKIPATISDRLLPTALQTAIDNDGFLHVMGRDDESLLEGENLFLNKLALKLSLQKLHMSGMLSAYKHPELKALRLAIADFNRHPKRGWQGFGKLDISRDSQNAVIPLVVARYEYPLLAGEKL